MQNVVCDIVWAGDPGAVIWLIVIVATVIAQLVKAGKRLSQGQTPPGTDSGAPKAPPTAPQDELREFLENLTGTRTAPPQAPVPPQAPAHPARPQRRGTAPRQVRRPVAPPPPLPAAPAPAVARQTVRPAARGTMRAAKAYKSRKRTRFKSGVIKTTDLQGNANLRRAIALMEVFAAPRALRPPGM